MGQHRQMRKREAHTVERAIVLQVLRDDRDERWTPAELIEEVSDLRPEVVREGVCRLECEGVLARMEDWVLASRAACRLDELELIGI
jgi:hypothetical protein